MQTKVDDFLASLGGQRLHPIYLVAGDEPLQARLCVDALRDKCQREDITERISFDAGVDLHWDSVQAELCSPSLFAQRRFFEVRLRNQALGADGARVLGGFCQRPEQTDVVLVTIDKVERKQHQSVWFKTIDKAGVIVQVWPIRPAMLPRWLQRRAQSKGIKLTADAAELLAAKVEGNLLAAEQELERMVLILGPGMVDAKAAAYGLTNNTRFDVFALVDAGLQGDAARTVQILQGLRAEGVEPIIVNWALTRELRQLCHSAEPGANRPEKPAYVAPMRQSLINAALRRHSPAALRRMLVDAGRIDRTLKGITPGDPWVEILDVLLRLTGSWQGLHVWL